MIKANELRIGNIVMETIYDFEPKQIVISREHFSQPEDYYEPIPLTEEWLMRFGFGRLGKYSFRDKNLIIHHRKRGFVVNKKIAIIQYVHQLQNLYFAFTQTELTLSNP